MKYPFLASVILLIACNSQPNTKYLNEVIKYNPEIEAYLIKESDSVHVETFEKGSSIRHYYKSKNRIGAIGRNKVGIVRFFSIEENGKTVDRAEVYPNGQYMGKLHFNAEGKIDGLTTYYYEDGTVRAQGYYKNGNEVGEWKDYNADGTLKSTTNVDE